MYLYVRKKDRFIYETSLSEKLSTVSMKYTFCLTLIHRILKAPP